MLNGIKAYTILALLYALRALLISYGKLEIAINISFVNN